MPSQETCGLRSTQEVEACRQPRIGDTVTYILLKSGRRWQFAAQVTGLYPDGSTSSHPSIRVVFWNNHLRYVPRGLAGRLLAALGYDFGLSGNWEETGWIQYRDGWWVGGGDDFGEHWCWPAEAEATDYYIDVGDRPAPGPV